MPASGIAEAIDALLPQTQCTRCGYPTCRAYADAIAASDADINQCPPGGAEGVAALARLLGRESKPLDTRYGIEAPPLVALIDEAACIGCTKCIQACPVDAIVGAPKRMHTVIAAQCTGCELCLPPCPVDCIALVSESRERDGHASLARLEVLTRAAQARTRFDAREHRLDRERIEKAARGVASRPGDAGNAAPISRAAVLAAIARGKARRDRQPDLSSGN